MAEMAAETPTPPDWLELVLIFVAALTFSVVEGNRTVLRQFDTVVAADTDAATDDECFLTTLFSSTYNDGFVLWLL